MTGELAPSVALLLTLGGIFLLGMLADLVSRRLPLPRVSLLLASGFAVGPGGFDLLPAASRDWFPLVSHVALVMVGFLVGGYLTRGMLKAHGLTVVVASVLITAATALVVLVGSLAVGLPLAAALLLSAIATATDPAATLDTIRASRARGPFTRTVIGIVALDDALGLVAFTVALALASLVTDAASVDDALRHGAVELGGAVLLGLALGIPMAFLTGRIRPGEPTQAEALGIVLLCGGLALWAEVSYLLSAMVMGLVVANLARHHRRPFHAIEGVEWPFLNLFFVLAGASMEVEMVRHAGLALVAFVVLRVLGRCLGGWLSAALLPFLGWRPAAAQDAAQGAGQDGAQHTASRCSDDLGDPDSAEATAMTAQQANWLGAALLPQAGVAIGMCLVASQRLPDLADLLLPVVLAATVVFEIVGPALTRLSLLRVGEAHRQPTSAP